MQMTLCSYVKTDIQEAQSTLNWIENSQTLLETKGSLKYILALNQMPKQVLFRV